MASIVVEAGSLIGVFIACGIAYALGYKQGMDTMSRIDNRIIEEAVKEIYGEGQYCERNSGKKNCEQLGRHQQEPRQNCDIPGEDSKNESGSADSAGRAGGNGR